MTAIAARQSSFGTLISPIWIVLLATIVIAALLSEKFLGAANLVAVLQQVVIAGIVALGMNIVLIGGHFDLSTGSIVMMSAVFSLLLGPSGLAGILLNCLAHPRGHGRGVSEWPCGPILAVSNEPSEAGIALLSGFSGPDDYVQGQIAAELLRDVLGGKGGIGIIEGSPGQSTTLLRTNGLKDKLKELNSGIEILGAPTGDWNPVKAKDVAQAFLTAYGDKMVGLFAQDDNSGAAAAEVFKAAGRGGIKVVGTGGTFNGLKAIKDGLMYGTMDQSPTTDARQALEMAIKLARGEALPQKRNIIPMPKITAANAGEFKGGW